jgi:hypothetical protein
VVLKLVAGVHISGRRDGERVYAALVGETDDIGRILVTNWESGNPAIADADCFYWICQPNPRMQSEIVRTIVRRYKPRENAALPGNQPGQPGNATAARPAACPSPAIDQVATPFPIGWVIVK